MTAVIKKYKHVIWDWNGTLYNDVELCVSIMNYLLTQESLPTISTQKYKEIFTFPVIEYYKIAGHTFERKSFEILGRQFMEEYEMRKNNCSLFPEVNKIIEKLYSENIQQHLLSAYEQISLNRTLTHYGIINYFQNVVGLDNIYAIGKLKLAQKLAAKLRSNGFNDDILLIGDTIHDYEVAKEIGADCVLISQGHQDENRLSQLSTPLVKNLSEFQELYMEELF